MIKILLRKNSRREFLIFLFSFTNGYRKIPLVRLPYTLPPLNMRFSNMKPNMSPSVHTPPPLTLHPEYKPTWINFGNKR